MKIKIVAKSENTITLAVDSDIFDSYDSEFTNIEVQFNNDPDIVCEHDSCENQSAPYILFLDWSPAQSIPAECLAHQPQALREFVAAI